MTESYIERKVCQYAKQRGVLVYKFVSPSNRAVPDRLFIKQGKVLFIEFKSFGKKPTKLQNRVMDTIRKQKIDVHVVDNVDDGIALINKL